MPSPTEITVSQLSRLVGLPMAPALIDLRTDADYAADPRLLPGARRRDHRAVRDWAHDHAGRSVVAYCTKGAGKSAGVAAYLRTQGIAAETLSGGFAAWRDAGELLVRAERLPPRDPAGRTLWVTRARPKIDRIACPWLIRRFVDPQAMFLFVAPPEIESVAAEFGATPFDIEGAFWSHRNDLCTFDTMLAEFGLESPALAALAVIVRGADTAQLELSPQSPGLLAASLGFSRMYKDDLPQLDATMPLYDAFYRWCRDATGETHNWPAGNLP